jgi:hypothetical protein
MFIFMRVRPRVDFTDTLQALTHEKITNDKAAIVFLTFFERFMTKIELLQLLKRRILNHAGSKVIVLRVCNFFLLWIRTRINDFQHNPELNEIDNAAQASFLSACGQFVMQDGVRKLLVPIVKDYPVSFAVGAGGDAMFMLHAPLQRHDTEQMQGLSVSPMSRR